MLKAGAKTILSTYVKRVPALLPVQDALEAAVTLLSDCFAKGGKLLICGNGGSCADADHIVGELVKSFRMERRLEPSFLASLPQEGRGSLLGKRLHGGLPAINLGAQCALITAMINDVGGEYVFAQQVATYGRPGDVFLGISTSGNSENILLAGTAAKAKGLKTVGLTGRDGGTVRREFDLALCVDADSVEDIQDLHSTVYHAICAAVEYQFWGD